jgi:hypothetical protein
MGNSHTRCLLRQHGFFSVALSLPACSISTPAQQQQLFKAHEEEENTLSRQ